MSCELLSPVPLKGLCASYAGVNPWKTGSWETCAGLIKKGAVLDISG